MGRVVLFLVLVLSLGDFLWGYSLSAQDTRNIISAEKEFVNGNFFSAAELLRNEIQQKKISSELYYNIAMAYFRENQMSDAMLFTLRGLYFFPYDSRLQKFYVFLNEKLMLSDSLNYFDYLSSWQSWLKISVIFFWASIGTGIFFSTLFLLTLVFDKKKFLLPQRILFAVSVFALLTALISFLGQKIIILKQNQSSVGMIQSKDAKIYSSAGFSQDFSSIEPSSLVKIIDKQTIWYKVETAQKRSGYVLENQLSLIGEGQGR